MFVVSDENNLIQSIESLSAKTEDTVTREHNCTVEQTGERGRVEFLLQMGKSHAYEAYAITSGLDNSNFVFDFFHWWTTCSSLNIQISDFF